MTSIIKVQDLRKTYDDVVAVDGISFEVAEGEIFGMVGPNGAGKTTTIECIEGLRNADSGQMSIFDLDPQHDRSRIAERIGIQLQQSALPARIRVSEALVLFASFYQRQADPQELLKRLGLTEKRSSAYAKLSGGQKQRLFIALALINSPEVVFLDELTTGLDPQARRAMWDLVRDIREQGRTVFLTTHYMEEAERLCDRVAILDHGRIVALDTPEALIRSLGVESRLVFTLPNGSDDLSLQDLPQVSRVETSGDRVVVYGSKEGLASAVLNALEDAGIDFQDLRTEQPNLEDVFLALTGREMRE
ncbi:MAG TPA: ABC transporter ATP-binding protein [Anaerolineae bacterium]|nr:ABC transporter ATP-binding protein [Anaerolineae bacterium]